MTYSIEVTSRFEREFKKLDRYTKLMINAWIEKNLLDCENLGTCKKTLIENRKISMKPHAFLNLNDNQLSSKQL